ncbi:Ig-like domain-containing protein [Tsukamurella tyrosinosolvens]|uniref:Lipoprotein-anchoring transpeptidase ErfK/SrfK n=1 Tax=Tsukamurella tyrosinosolvens TaxID=57704 RepID=A0A1H5AEW4_TSUTY|nr:Ig-like domain-containing protein [Tsukamurella tyrosinosolvens]AUN42150.1 L,D-transpeptidase [Tsukamurella tyrosinosolvens]KXO95364.1 L,D-transpeptidase [Tsukamurella tyrosinosolvens]KXP07415.1 L,D-transpeptidase [Tsukamurella tyrosinosolvens]KZL98616.1 L,D-transpeptidase [Tsukamurella tyrosinosolvens]MEC4614765.1 Ig-like domain-containing protein [Tsukamurella tyrosinosolvens]
MFDIFRAPVRRRAFLGGAAATVAVAATACTRDGGIGETRADAPTFEYAPAAGKKIGPRDTVSVRVRGGTFRPGVALTNTQSGKKVELTPSPDGVTYSTAEPLGFGATYRWSGAADGEGGTWSSLDGEVAVVSPDATMSVQVNIADGAEVGIAAPLILKFAGTVEDKAAVEKALEVTTTPHTEGAWAWLPEDNGSRAHWRPREYFTPGTKVAMNAKLYGLDHGGGQYGASDVTSDFVVGRSQIVKASAPSHRILVMRGDQVHLDLPCSYGEGDLPRNVTRSGIHVVSEKHEDFAMSNPAAGYFNVRERWAVRISNNGEFIHANPNTVGNQGASNVTNGCINLSLEDAQRYFQSALFGDPVEVTGTSIELSEADGDIYDWTLDWPTWQSMSALAKN